MRWYSDQHVYYGYCQKCSRFYTIFTSNRRPPFACPGCNCVFNKHYTIAAFQKLTDRLKREPLSSPELLPLVFNRARPPELRAFWAQHRDIHKKPALEALGEVFSHIDRTRMRPRHRTVHAAMIYEILVATRIRERHRYRNIHERGLPYARCHKCDEKVATIFHHVGGCIECSPCGRLKDVGKLLLE